MTQGDNRAELEQEVMNRHKQGESRRKIAKALHISRNTVRKILNRLRQQRDHGHCLIVKKPYRAPRHSKLDAYQSRIDEVLKTYPKVTGQRLFEILCAEGYTGGISILRNKLRALRPQPRITPVVRFETDPGVQGQMDWSPYTIPFKDKSHPKVLCFSYVLGYSRRHYIDFVRHRDFITLIRRHQDAFAYFGGVPQQCLYDNEKTVVLRWEAQQPIFNPAFLQFITHYHCKPIACKPGRPQTKGKVEAPFLYIENNLLNAREFENLEQLRTTARWWLANVSDPHIHNTTRRAPLEIFLAEEQQALQPLPLHPYDTAEIGFCLGTVDGFVQWKTNRYSIPYEHVGQILTVRATETEFFVYNPAIDLIAHHERLADASRQKTERPEHRVRAPQIRYGLEPVRQTFLALGEAAEVFLQGLKQRYPRNCGFHAKRILQLKEQYHTDDIHRALQHAMRYHAYDGMAIERIVKARCTPRTLEDWINEKSREKLRDILPAIKQRSLAEYQSFCQSVGSEATPCMENEDASTDTHTPQPVTAEGSTGPRTGPEETH